MDEFFENAQEFDKRLLQIRGASEVGFAWYPYGALNNFIHLKSIMQNFPIESLVSQGEKILDIGAADGDVAFFLESLGYRAEIIDNGPTNMNGLNGARFLKRVLKSKVKIRDIDLDDLGVKLPSSKYNLIIFLGILYHLKNPYSVLEQLSNKTNYMFLSTRIARNSANGIAIFDQSLAYLVGPHECNNDPTNYWIFSMAGLEKILDRTGWDILESKTVGDTNNSNPFEVDHDERCFMLLKSRKFS